MGIVWAAVNVQTSREVAIKLIVRSTQDLRLRLLREARACLALSHRNIIEVLDVGEDDNGDPFLVMPLLQGETLADLLSRRFRLNTPIAAQIGCDVARALTAAHSANIIHRDLKPANIFLHREPSTDMVVVKVLDFGVSKNLSTEEAMATVTGQVVGSPAYMSPEQIRAARDIDLRSDVWSLGVVLFEMLSGRRPFQGGAQEVIAKILSGNVPRISKFVRNIDPTLDALIANCLQTDRDRRMSSAADLAKILNGFVSSRNDMLLLTSEPSNYTTASPQTTTGTLIPTAPVNVGRTSIESESKRRTSTSAEHAVPPDHARDNASSDPTRGPYVQGGTVKIPLEDLRHRAPSTLPEKKKDGDSTAQPFSTLSATLDSRKNFETASLLALWKELPRRLRITLVIAAISVTFIVLGLCAYAIILIKTKK